MRRFKVAHFSFEDDYGASAAAYELHKSLREMGVQSQFFVRNKTREDDSIIELGYCNTVEERLLRLINKMYFDENRKDLGVSPVNFDYLGIQWDSQIEKKFNEFDIFHIHWVAGFLSIDNIQQLIKLNKPIIWTMHDFHPFTGGCHCPEFCFEYERECSDCWELRQNEMNITKYLLEEKQLKYSSNIQVIVASSWLKNIIQRSKVFSKNECTIIPIGVDVNTFRPLDKISLKKKLGISEFSKVILIGAQTLHQRIKGYIHLKKILEVLEKDYYCRKLIKTKQIILLTFGTAAKLEIGNTEIPIVNMGFIQDREKLCEIYNTADVFLFPSTQDTFGMAAVEAMACGVPAIAFDTCAMKDVIISGINGFKAEVGDYLSMAAYIVEILRKVSIDRNLCRKRIIDNFSLECEANTMTQFYYEIMGNFDKKINGDNIETKNEKIENFINKCAFEILTSTRDSNDKLQEMLLEYSCTFMSPEQKVRKLINENKIENKKSVYIYGAGEFGRRTLRELKKNKIDIINFFDLDKEKEGKLLEGYPVKNLVRKDELDKKIIIVAGIRYLDMIKCLIELGYIYNQDFY